jgi:hypothetical protein
MILRVPQDGEYLEQMNECHLLRKGSKPSSYGCCVIEEFPVLGYNAL